MPSKKSTAPIATPAIATPAKTQSLPPDWHYEGTVRELETIIGRIETGELELAEVFQQFTQAVEYLNQCELFLNHHQQQADLMIETLLDRDDPSVT